MRISAPIAAFVVALPLLLTWSRPALPQQESPQPGVEQAGLVSLRITVQDFNPAVPWNKKPERMVLGNALVVREGLLLTTADLVKNATLVEVRKFGSYPDFPARTLLLDHELDLALLEVDSAEFWRGLRPLPLSEAPVVAGRFDINRWRHNGRFEQGSGEVVELKVATSRFGNLEIPELRASTAMRGLGWAEVLTSQGKMTGIVTSQDQEGLQANMSPLLRLFIEAYGRSPYRGFAHRGFAWQQLNQAALRRFHDLEENSPGILVRRLLAGGTGSTQLREGDILLRLGGNVIDPEGRIFHPLYGRILFTIAINETLDETIPALVIRDGREQELTLRRRLFAKEDYRIQPYQFGRPIDFEMFGGLVVQELSLGYLRFWGREWRYKAPTRLVVEYFLNNLRKAGAEPEKVIVISSVLPDRTNVGYEGIRNSILRRVNGVPLKSLHDFRAAVTRPVNGFHVLELIPGGGRDKLVFRADEIEEANRRIRERFGVPEPRERLTAKTSTPGK